MGPVVFTKGPPALMLRYRTATPLSDVPALRVEADELWNRFIVDVERGHYVGAVISANGPDQGHGMITKGAGYNFIFKKDDQSWRTLEAGDKRLDEAFVRAFVGRLDGIFERNQMYALLLYMADDWTVAISKPDDPSAAPQLIDRNTFVTQTSAVLSQAKGLRHTREILKVTVSGDGKTAEVESRETEDFLVNGNKVGDIEHSTDDFRLQDGVMLWTHSKSVREQVIGAVS